jgi:toxin ParE1/3/4
MREVHKSRAASIDLDNIWYYIAADNPDAADAFLYRLFARCESYAHQPSLGESRPEFGRQVRCFSVEKFVVYYKPVTEGIELIRVLHGARDIQQL